MRHNHRQDHFEQTTGRCTFSAVQMRAASLGGISESPFPAGTASGRNQRSNTRTAAPESTTSELPQALQGFTGPSNRCISDPSPSALPKSVYLRQSQIASRWVHALSAIGPERRNSRSGADPARPNPRSAALCRPGPGEARRWGHRETRAAGAELLGRKEEENPPRTRGKGEAAAPKSQERAAPGGAMAWAPVRGVRSGHEGLLHSPVLLWLRVTQGHARQHNKTNDSLFSYQPVAARTAGIAILFKNYFKTSEKRHTWVLLFTYPISCPAPGDSGSISAVLLLVGTFQREDMADLSSVAAQKQEEESQASAPTSWLVRRGFIWVFVLPLYIEKVK